MEDKLENNRLKYIKYTCERHGIDQDSIEGQLIYYAYGHGYHQAEKDNELTWKDISMIREIFCGMVGYPLMTDKEVCKEVLNRFKERKEK